MIAAVIGVVALALPTSRVIVVAGSVLVLFGSLAFVTSTIAGLVRHELARHARKTNETVERGLLDVLPPRQLADRLLDRVYGPSPYNRQMVTALLGGEGEAIDGGDLTISEHTEIDVLLTTIDDHSYELVIEGRYSFKNRVPTSTFVIFATSDRSLRDSIISGCRLPLFEQWFVPSDGDSSRFEESVEEMRESMRVGMRFADARGSVHEMEARVPGSHVRDVKIQDWGRYLSFFRTDLAEGLRIDRQDFMGSLRILEVDLHGLAEPSAAVATILQLTFRSTTIQSMGGGGCYWQAPYPCFLERFRFDTSQFKLPGEPEIRFSLKPFSIGGLEASTWSTAWELVDLDARTWMLPGHGVALWWRGADWLDD